MSATAVVKPQITPTDRFSMTLCLALILHGVIVLGVTFVPEDKPQPRYESMEIILVQQQSLPQKDAQTLAQASLEGGGNTSEDVTPSSPTPPPFPDNTPDTSAPPPTEAQPEPTVTETIEQIPPEVAPAEQAVEELAVESHEAEQLKTEVLPEKPEPEKAVKEAQQASKPKQTKKRPSATALLANSFKIAALTAKVRQKLEAKAERPKRKFISASTQEYKYAAYMEAWRAKVQRLGNLNYPEEAIKRGINGSLILDVALNPDGSINEISVRRSSGQKLLDDAAIRIVKMASPYAAFPNAIDKETDILHITRTWRFLNNRFSH